MPVTDLTATGSGAGVGTGDDKSTSVPFQALGLPRPLLSAIQTLGFATPTAIQAAAIPALLAGRDVTGVAQTGTGKTAAFGLPLLAGIDPAERRVQALVLTPTRELALQVAGALQDLAAGLRGVQVAAVYGGAPLSRQVTALRRGAQVVVGTPGRIIDHLDRGTLRLDAVRFAVLDEADEMLRMGFVDEVDRILSAAPAQRQTALFSATMPAAIRSVAARHLQHPKDVSVAASAAPVSAIRQRYAVLRHRDKVDALVRILSLRDGPAADAEATVVFVRTRSTCEQVGSQLAQRGISVAAISGDVTQRERERTMARLRSGQVDVLVATDVAARGLDVDRIGLVVNFDAPSDPESYIHRIGRTGRAGRAGDALLFVTPQERSRLRAIQRATGRRLEQVTPPTASEVTAHRASWQMHQAIARHGAGNLDGARAALEAAAEASGLPVTELAAALLAVTVGDNGSTPEADPEASHDRLASTKDRRGYRNAVQRNSTGADRYVVQVGRRHGVRPAGIVGAITGEGGLSGSDVGRIDIFEQHSVVEITRPVGAAAWSRIRRATVSGQQLRIRPDRPAGRDEGRTTKTSRANGKAGGHRAQNKAGWASGSRRRGPGRAPSGKRDSALPGTPRNS